MSLSARECIPRIARLFGDKFLYELYTFLYVIIRINATPLVFSVVENVLNPLQSDEQSRSPRFRSPTMQHPLHFDVSRLVC